jgi:putative CocE/NonD family hydrolase
MTLGRAPFTGRTCLADQLGPTPLGAIPERAGTAWVRAYDGTRLATDVYLPPGRGPFGAVLCRLPYDKAGDHAWIPAVATRLVEDGFAFIAQDVRGKARSEGAIEPFLHERADGAATLDWIEAQRWSNGRVGMWGQSYFGYTQWAAAVTGHRALRCIVPQVTAAAIGTDWMYRQGVFRLQTMAEWTVWAWTEQRMLGFLIDWRALPVCDLGEIWSGRPNVALSTWTQRGPRSRYWQALSATPAKFSAVRAAVLSVGGFWDVFQRGQISDHQRLARSRPATRARLWMAARDHYGSEWTAAGESSPDYERDPALIEAALDRYLGPAPGWYHAWLRRERAPRGRRVEYQVAGDRWRAADGWPPSGSRTSTYWLRQGLLSEQPTARRLLVTLQHEPDHPVPSLDHNPWRLLFDPPDRRHLGERDDVAAFDTEPLEAPLVLAGPAAVQVAAEADRPQAYLHARLVHVDLNDTAHLLSDGASRLPPSGAVRIDLGHLAVRLPRGHRLRLEFSTTDFPRYARASGGCDPLTASRLFSYRLRCTLDDRSLLRVTTMPEAT